MKNFWIRSLITLSTVLFMQFAFASVDLNTATQAQLEAVKGLGPVKSKAIVDYRTKNGAFKTVEDVQKVPGIKAGVFAKVKTELTVGGKPAAVAVKKEKAK